jgi:hypothetical protein
MLARAQNNGLPIKYIELANELHFDTGHYNLETFPTRPGNGTAYAAAANYFAKRIKEIYPDVRIAAIGGEGNPGQSFRRLNWNRLVVPLLDRAVIDAVTIHNYITTSSQTMTPHNRFAAFIKSWKTQWDDTVIASHIDSLVDNNWAIWITEFMTNHQRESHKTWGNGLLTSFAQCTYLNAMDVQMACNHQWQGLEDGNGGINGLGRVLSMWGRAANGKSIIGTLAFSGAPVLPDTDIPALFGFSFSDGASKNILVFNLSDSEQSLGVANFNAVGKTFKQAAPEAISQQTDPGISEGACDEEIVLFPYSITIIENLEPTATHINLELSHPTRFQLSAFPNPFNQSVKITYSIPKASPIRLMIYNCLGLKICDLQKTQTAGEHSFVWDGKSANGLAVASGVYYVSLVAGGLREFAKLVVLR